VFSAPSQFIFGATVVAEAERIFALDRKYVLDELGIGLPEPHLGNRECRFFLDSDALAEISTAARNLGNSADALINAAAQYVRTRPRSGPQAGSPRKTS